MSLDFSGFLKALAPHKSIGITAPASADGDSVGTQCALKEIFEKLFPEKNIRIVNEEPCPKRYSFLNQAKFSEVSETIVKTPPSDWPEVMICVDGSTSRIGVNTTKIWSNAKLTAQVDHHAISDGAKYDVKLCDPEAAATTEIVYRLLLDQKIKLTKDIAQAIYMGLIFDTGLFKHSNTKPETMRIGAALLETGFNHTTTAEKALLMRTASAFSLLKDVLSRVQLDLDGRFCWAVLDQEMLVRAKAGDEDRDGIIENLFLIDGVKVASLLFETQKGIWKISFRSRGPNVAALAQRLNPQGGGHKLASGCTLEGTKENVLAKCHAEVKLVIDEDIT
jgi:bifunctional oligoribonuclease and PAP phosphatase NrnA